jgi:hypothetical protein
MNGAVLIDQIPERLSKKLLTPASIAAVERDRFVLSPLSGPQGIPVDVRNCRTVRIASFRIAESMGFASFANGSTCKGVYYIGEIDHDHTAWKSVDFRDRLQLPYGRSQLEAVGSTEESTLSAAKRDLLSVFRTKTRPPSVLSRGCSMWPRLTIELLLARKKIELSSLCSRLPRERRRRMLPLVKCTSVEFRNASRREISSIRTIQTLESSVRKAKSSRRSLTGSRSPKQELIPHAHGKAAGDENGLVASTTNITRECRSVEPLLSACIGISAP